MDKGIIIERLNKNSFTIKTYSFVLTLLFLFDILHEASTIVCVGYALFNTLLWCLDSQYLLSEWRIRAIDDDNAKARLGKHPYRKAFFSKSMVIYYPAFIIAMFVFSRLYY